MTELVFELLTVFLLTSEEKRDEIFNVIIFEQFVIVLIVCGFVSLFFCFIPSKMRQVAEKRRKKSESEKHAINANEIGENHVCSSSGFSKAIQSRKDRKRTKERKSKDQ